LPPDVLEISSRHVSEINGNRVIVRPDGKINLPLLGEIYVAGLTPRQIEEQIEKKASAYYEVVDATVNVAEYNSQNFYVFGEVYRPGPYRWTGSDTLLDALANAQPTRLAWPERIKVVRGSRPQRGGYATSQPSDQYVKKGIHPPSPEHPREEMTINLMAMIDSGDLANNILLKPNDVIYVQPNPFAAIGLAIQQVLFPVRPVLEAARVPATIENAANPGQ